MSLQQVQPAQSFPQKKKATTSNESLAQPISAFNELVLLCRPRDVFAFAEEFFSTEMGKYNGSRNNNPAAINGNSEFHSTIDLNSTIANTTSGSRDPGDQSTIKASASTPNTSSIAAASSVLPPTGSVTFVDSGPMYNASVMHAIHALPYLLYSPEQFRVFCMTVFCYYIQSHPQCATKRYLDGTIVTEEIIRKMHLPKFWIEVKAIELAIKSRIAGLKKIDFNLFVSAMRFPVASYQLSFWIKDELICFFSSQSSSTSGSPRSASTTTNNNNYNNNSSSSNCSSTIVEENAEALERGVIAVGCLIPGIKIDVAKLKNYEIQKLSSSVVAATTTTTTIGTGSAGVVDKKFCSSSSYHMHACWSDVDCKVWSKVLISTLENLQARSGSSTAVEAYGRIVVSAGQLVEEFVEKYLSLCNTPTTSTSSATSSGRSSSSSSSRG